MALIKPNPAADYAQSIANAETAYDIFRVLKQICTQYGFKHFSCITLPKQGEEKLADLSVVSNWPPELVNAYDAHGLLKNSPIIARLRESVEPIIWQIEKINSSREAGERNLAVELFEDFDFRSGVYLSVHTADGRVGAVSFAGDRKDPSTQETMDLNYLSMLAFERLLSFADSVAGNDNQVLTPREAECLRWTGAGKTTSEIAIILDISEHTINNYLASTCQKLNAQNRAHAVSKAMRLGIVD